MKYTILALAFLGITLPASAQTEAQSLPTSPAIIDIGDTEINLTVELADDPAELATGLMFRQGVPEGTGMLFDFGNPREANMYMRNVPFGLDMLFLDTDGEILAIVARVQPFSERLINPGFPVQGVLEIGSGQANELGIEPGDIVRHAMFEDTDPATESE